jgi:hypothetical protein
VIQSTVDNTPSGYLLCNGATVSKTTYSSLYGVIGDQFAPLGVIKESGGIPWQSQYGFNSSTQDDITGWVSDDNLVTATVAAAPLVTKNYMYILGGYNGNGPLNTIQRASFDNDGNLSSSWSNVGTLPIALQNMGYAATKGRIYLIGGYNESSGISTVYSAPVNTDGTLGDFRTETSLPDVMANATCFVIKNKLYAVGGYSNTVYRTTVNSDGTLSSWETLPNFPINFYSRNPLLIKNRIYIFEAFDVSTEESRIYYATYDSDGNIGSWAYVLNMLNNIHDSVIVCTDNYIFSIGGYDQNNNQYVNASYKIPISADGDLEGGWVQISDGPIAAFDAQVAIAGNKIYFISGYDSNNNVLNTVYSATFTSGITDYTPYYTDQRTVDPNNFYLPNYYPDFKSIENYYIKY